MHADLGMMQHLNWSHIMPNARAVNDGSYLQPNSWSAVDSGDGPCTLYVSSMVEVGQFFVVMNATRRDVRIRIGSDAFPLVTIDNTAVDEVAVHPGSSILAVASWSDTYNTRALAFTIVNDGTGEGGDPSGDWLPTNNPTYTGTLTGGEAVFAFNPTLTGTVATAELSDMALIAKGQIWDILNGNMGTINPGPASGIVDATHFGSTIKPGAVLTLPDLGEENGMLNMISDADVNLKLSDDHPGTLYSDGVNRGPSVTVPRGVFRKLIQISGNWYMS